MKIGRKTWEKGPVFQVTALSSKIPLSHCLLKRQWKKSRCLSGWKKKLTRNWTHVWMWWGKFAKQCNTYIRKTSFMEIYGQKQYLSRHQKMGNMWSNWSVLVGILCTCTVLQNRWVIVFASNIKWICEKFEYMPVKLCFFLQLQTRSIKFEKESDIYSLGLVSFEILLYFSKTHEGFKKNSKITYKKLRLWTLPNSRKNVGLKIYSWIKKLEKSLHSSLTIV